MTRSLNFVLFIALTVALTIPCAGPASGEVSDQDVETAMKRAVSFMMDTVSNRGGFLWKYTNDLSDQWGEVPARPTQIWVQGGTVTVGEMLLDAWRTTKDPYYLEQAKRIADALIWGQHPAGGWHYLIDFDMPGIQNWYDTVASKCWGWEEYYHYYGNCTYDDNVTTGATRLLLGLYIESLDPAYRPALDKALGFILESQYPNGGWPQRYPIKREFSKDGIPDYTAWHTFNDMAIHDCIMVLWQAWEKLGDERYREAARRGMDFYIISQYAEPQAGWCEQHDLDLKPAQARSYEPASIDTRATSRNVRDLEQYYTMTGDRRYLAPILPAIRWMEASVTATAPDTQFTHARRYEPGTNRPLYTHLEGTNIDNGRYYINYEPTEDVILHRGQIRIDTVGMHESYEKHAAMTPDEALAKYRNSRTATTPRRPDSAEVERVVNALDQRGAWVTEIQLRDYDMPSKPGPPPFKGIETRIFVANMRMLIGHVGSAR
jgi:PelA/Pel-15E family pectate lyase